MNEAGSGHPHRTAGSVRVWDRFVRIFHWSVVAAFFVAWFTEDDLLALHVWAGYTVGVLVVMRIAWGFVGPRHARFTSFVCSPWRAWRYLLDLAAFRAERHIGHSPAGGAMVVLLLAGLLGVVWSGLELHAAENGAGPLAATTAGPGLVPAARADGDERGGARGERRRGRGGGIWEDVHETLANVVMALVIAHVAGVLLASVVHRENLVRSMFTGDKRAS